MHRAPYTPSQALPPPRPSFSPGSPSSPSASSLPATAPRAPSSVHTLSPHDLDPSTHGYSPPSSAPTTALPRSAPLHTDHNDAPQYLFDRSSPPFIQPTSLHPSYLSEPFIPFPHPPYLLPSNDPPPPLLLAYSYLDYHPPMAIAVPPAHHSQHASRRPQPPPHLYSDMIDASHARQSQLRVPVAPPAIPAVATTPDAPNTSSAMPPQPSAQPAPQDSSTRALKNPCWMCHKAFDRCAPARSHHVTASH
ncbi:hypothetical protein BDW22DRAFT_1122526 [Trametopsis cervina]|nr:hypothetical protein BDW22DRAFT_1122526 [Trametopsis cervina]